MTQWREQDHPRWPADTAGGRGGEFRDRAGGWVAAVASAIRTPEADLRDLIGRGRIVRSEKLHGGRVASTSRVTVEDTDGTHHDLVQKTYGGSFGRQNAAREVVVAAIGHAIGARVPVTTLDPRYGGEALYMEFLEGQTALEYGGGSPLRLTIISGEQMFTGGDLPDFSLLERFTDSSSGRRLGLLDLMTSNTDRHAGNWLVDEEDEVAGIDHSHVHLGGPWPRESGWLNGTFADSYLHQVETVDEEGFRVDRAELDPIEDLSPAEAERIRQRLVALFEDRDLRRLLVRANVDPEYPERREDDDEAAQEYVDGLLMRWDAIAAMARKAD